MANHQQAFNQVPNSGMRPQHGMNHYNMRGPPPNQIRHQFPQGYQPLPFNHAAAQTVIPAQFQHGQITYITNPGHGQTNGVRSQTPIQQGGYGQPAPQTPYNFQQSPAGLPPGSQAPTQQNIFHQQPQQFIAPGAGAIQGVYPHAAGLQHYRFSYPPQGHQIIQHQHHTGSYLGAMQSQSQQPTGMQPTPGPTPPMQAGAPMQGTAPPSIPQPHNNPAQQQQKSVTYPQASIAVTLPPPSSTPSLISNQHVAVVSSISGAAASAGNAATTYQPPPPQHQQITVTQPPPELQKRAKKPLQFVNPNTGQALKLPNHTSGASTTNGSLPTQAPPVTSNTAPNVPPTISTTSSPPPVLATAPVSMTTPQVETPILLSAGGVQTSDMTHSTPPPQVTASIPSTDVKEATPPPPLQQVSKGEPISDQDTAVQPSQIQDKEMLSVTVETKRGDETPYEPISPTPLPDSPVEETKVEAAAEVSSSSSSSVVQKQPLERSPSLQDDEALKGKKKKIQKAKITENRKGSDKENKGGDLLDVFKPTVNDSLPTPTSKISEQSQVFKEPSPPTPRTETPINIHESTPQREQEPKTLETQVDFSTPHMPTPPPEIMKVNGVGNEYKMDVESTPTTAIHEVIELEEGEILETPENRRSTEPKLKYEYKEDMWSPLNPSGKKQYDRDFLIQLQFDDLSQIKPEQLPDMDIIKDKPIRRDISRSSYNFEPSYIKSSVSQSRGGHGGPRSDHRGEMGKRPSKSKEPKRIHLGSIHQNVELRKSDKAWVPSVAEKGADDTQDDIEILKKKVRSILNKLTPQKFDILVQQFQDLNIDSRSKLDASMELVFEKAVDEPAFSVAYAQMCHILALKECDDADGNKVKFRSILIKRVQKEFEKDYMKDVDVSLKQKAENPEVGEEERKLAKEEYEAQELKARRRSLGNIRFIGELYNLKILTINIMHQCVGSLLAKDSDEEALEGLCRLITTVGAAFDKDTQFVITKRNNGADDVWIQKYKSVKHIDFYFEKMNRIISNRQTSSRVRFLMQDVIDLKKAGWKKRREEAGPKKIDQIHEDMKKEKLTAELNNMSTMSLPKQRDSQGGGNMGDARRRSQRGGHTTDDGWTLPTRPARNTLDKVDTNKLKSISRNTTDVESISLGPKGGGFGGWGKGSAGAGSRGSSARQDEINTSNRYASFSSSEASSNSPYEGRTSGGYERSGGGYQGRTSGSYGRPGSYVGRSSRGQSVDEKAKAIQAVKDQYSGGAGGRSVSTIMSSDSDRGRTAIPSKSASMRIPSKKREHSLFQGDANAEREKLETISESRVNEFLSTKDYIEVYQGLKEKFHANTIHIFLETTFNNMLERSATERRDVGILFSKLVKEGLVTEAKLVQGLSTIFECGSDLEIDIPKFWDTLSSLLVESIVDSNLSLAALTAESRTKEPEVKNREKFLAALLHGVKLQASEAKAASLWAASDVKLQEFLTSENGDKQDIASFIRNNNLEFLSNFDENSGNNSLSSSSNSSFNLDAFESDLRNRLKVDADCDAVNFVTDRLTDYQNRKDFIQPLMAALVEDSIEGLGGPINNLRLNQQKFETYCNNVLQKLIKNSVQELECLFAIQFLVNRLDHPSGIFPKLLETMYNSDVVKYPACQEWKADMNHPAGKSLAVQASNHLFVQMQEEEDDDDEDFK